MNKHSLCPNSCGFCTECEGRCKLNTTPPSWDQRFDDLLSELLLDDRAAVSVRNDTPAKLKFFISQEISRAREEIDQKIRSIEFRPQHEHEEKSHYLNRRRGFNLGILAALNTLTPSAEGEDHEEKG